MTPVSVVIPSWNGRHLLPFCLRALCAQDPPVAEIVVVDNGSSDGTGDWLAATWPTVKCLKLPGNAGFAAAVNAGIAATSAAYILVLNNDAALGPGYVATLGRTLDAHPEAGAVQGKVLSHQDPSLIDSLGIQFDAAMRATQIGYEQRDHGQHARRRIPGVTACAALYRRRALQAVALPGTPPEVFDSSFFAYYEDVDLALRLQSFGYAAWLEPSVSCEHVGSATGGRDSMGKAFLLGRNYLLYLAGNLGPSRLLALLPHLLHRKLRRLLTWPMHLRRDTALWAGEFAALPRLPSAFRKSRRMHRRLRERATKPPAA